MTERFRIQLRSPICLLPGRTEHTSALDLVVEPGRRTVLMGRSGAGKSLLARLALGRLPGAPVVTRGAASVQLGNRLVEEDFDSWPAGSHVSALAQLRGRQVSYVPQGGRENLVPGWTVTDHFHALLGRDEQRFEQACAGMDSLGVAATEDNLTAVATELSEGMIRRVLVALAMARGADVLVIDEPTTGLDPGSRQAFVQLVQAQILSRGAGVLVVTHDLDLCTGLDAEALLVHDGAIVARADRLEEGGPEFQPFLAAHRGDVEQASEVHA